MKRIISILIALTLVFSLCACGADAPVKDEGPKTPAQQLLASFNEKLGAGEAVDTIAQELIDSMPFGGLSMAVEEGWLNGFSADITGFESAVIFAPVIGSIPFVGYIFTLADGADVDAFTAMLKENANLSWNVCTSADEMVVDANGNYVFFVMAPASLEE